MVCFPSHVHHHHDLTMGDSIIATEDIAISNKVRKTVNSLKISFLLTSSNAPALLQEVQNTIGSSHDKCEQFGAAQGIPTLIGIMNQFEDEPEIQLQCCKILYELAMVTQNQVCIAEAAGIVAVLVAMLKHADTEMQELGCRTLARLCENSDANKNIVMETSGIEVILTAMQAYPTHAAIQAEGCHILSLLAARKTSHSAKVAALGGVKAVMVAIKQHNMDVSVQLHGCRALRYLTATNDANRGAVAAAGGIKTTLAAMTHFKIDTDILENACATLLNLITAHKHNASSIMACKGLPIVLGVMRQHEHVVGIQEAGCGVLRFLSDDDRNSSPIGQEGGITAILAAMRHFESMYSHF